MKLSYAVCITLIGLFGTLVPHTEARALPASRVEKIHGKVEILKGERGQESHTLSTEALFPESVILKTSQDASARVVTPYAIVDLAPGTAFRIERSKVRGSSAFLCILYGHARIDVRGNPDDLKYPVLFRLPTGRMQSTKGEVFVSVAQSRELLGSWLAGKFVAPPTVEEILSFRGSALVFTQVVLVDGELTVEPERSDKLTLKPGEMVQITRDVAGIFPTKVGATEIHTLRKLLR